MKKIIFFLFLSVICSSTFSQKPVVEARGLNWRIVPSLPNKMQYILSNTEPFTQSIGDMEASKIYVDNDEVILLVAYQKHKYGILRINNKLKTLWNTPLENVPIRIGVLNDKLIVITNDDFKFLSGFSDSYTATVVNTKTGKIEKTKRFDNSIFKNKSLPNFFTSESGTFFKIGIKGEDGYVVYDLNNQLDMSTSFKLKMNKTSSLLGCVNDKAGNIFCCFNAGGAVLDVREYNAKGEEGGHMECLFDAKNKSSYSANLFSGGTERKVYLSVNYVDKGKKDVAAFYSLDFASGEKLSNTTSLDKDYESQLKGTFVELDEHLTKLHPKDWDDMRTLQVLENGDQIIVWKEAHKVLLAGSGSTWITSDAIITIYSNKLKKMANAVIPKQMELFGPVGMFSSMHVKDNKLYYVSSHLRPIRPLAVQGIYDLSSLKMVKMNIVNKEPIDKLNPPDPKATLWFKDVFYIPYLDDHGFIKIKNIETDLQKFNY